MIRLAYCPGSGAIDPTPEAEIAKAVQLLDLMLEFFADDGHWTRGCYDDGNGGHCLVGALLRLGRNHLLPTAAAIALSAGCHALARSSARPLQRRAPLRGDYQSDSLIQINAGTTASNGELIRGEHEIHYAQRQAIAHVEGNPRRKARCG